MPMPRRAHFRSIADMRAKPLLTLVLLALTGAITWRALRPPAPTKTVELTGATMGGSWSVKLRALPPSTSEPQLQHTVANLLARLDADLSLYNPDSALSRFNAS